MKKLLVDSSIFIDFLRVKEKEKTPFFRLVKKNNQFYTSIIVHTEIYSGKSVWKGEESYLEVENLFSGIKILPITEEISKKVGELKANFMPDIVDAVLAATALLNKLTLVTLNIKDFNKIEELKLYKI